MKYRYVDQQSPLFLMFYEQPFLVIEFQFVHEVCITNKSQTKTNLQKQFHPFYSHHLIEAKCNAENQKMSAKGSNFTEDDRALPP